MHELPRDLVTILRTEARNQRTPPIDYVIAEDGGRMVHRPEPDIAMAELLEEAADKLEELAAENERLRAERVWQPIETAPMDGTKVDLWVVDPLGEGKRIPDCSWGWGQWIGSKGLAAERLGHKATHWIYRPTPPQEKDKEIAALREALRSPTAAEQAEPAPAARSGAVKVKALEWEETHSGGFEAESALGFYEISMGFGSDAYYWSVTNPLGDDVGSNFEDPSYAKAAAQADYERRVLSALEPAEPAPAAHTGAVKGEPEAFL